jgi:hypothetical protein
MSLLAGQQTLSAGGHASRWFEETACWRTSSMTEMDLNRPYGEKSHGFESGVGLVSSAGSGLREAHGCEPCRLAAGRRLAVVPRWCGEEDEASESEHDDVDSMGI